MPSISKVKDNSQQTPLLWWLATKPPPSAMWRHNCLSIPWCRLPRFTGYCSVTTSAVLRCMVFGSVSRRQTWPNHDNLREKETFFCFHEVLLKYFISFESVYTNPLHLTLVVTLPPNAICDPPTRIHSGCPDMQLPLALGCSRLAVWNSLLTELRRTRASFQYPVSDVVSIPIS